MKDFKIHSINFILRRILTLYCDLLVMLLIMTLWIKTNELIKSLNIEQPSGRKEILSALKSYQQLKELTTLINKCIGGTMTMYIMEIVLGYAVLFDEILDPSFLKQSLVQFFMAFFIFGSSCVPLLLAADISDKVNGFIDYLIN